MSILNIIANIILSQNGHEDITNSGPGNGTKMFSHFGALSL